jgi:hypothetical protein
VIQQEASSELSVDFLDKSFTLCKSFRSIIDLFRKRNSELILNIKLSLMRRHAYEHEYLNRWSRDCRIAAAGLFQPMHSSRDLSSTIGGSIVKSKSSISLSSLVFTPSIDAKDDGVTWIDGQGCLELGDMTLSLGTVKGNFLF